MGVLCGLSVRDMTLLAPGELYDQYELFLRANGKREPTQED